MVKWFLHRMASMEGRRAKFGSSSRMKRINPTPIVWVSMVKWTMKIVGGHYQPYTLPILKISKPKLDEKINDVNLPLVVGDKVKFTVGLEELREIVVDWRIANSDVSWNPASKIKVTKLKTIGQCYDAHQLHRCQEQVLMLYIYPF